MESEYCFERRENFLRRVLKGLEERRRKTHEYQIQATMRKSNQILFFLQQQQKFPITICTMRPFSTSFFWYNNPQLVYVYQEINIRSKYIVNPKSESHMRGKN